jgi:competence protein ComEA
MPEKHSGELRISTGWWITYGVLCGLLAAGLIVWLSAPQRGEPIKLLPAPTLTDPPQPVAVATWTPAPTEGPLMVNINLANMDELQKLPNIGPVLAQGIVNYRDSHGPFTRLEQIQNVSGIGPQTFEAMLPYITLGDQ